MEDRPPSHPGWALFPWSSLFINRNAWSWGLLMGPGKALHGRQEAWVRGMALRPGSEALSCVTLGYAYPSLSFSFLPGKMRHGALFYLVSASPTGSRLGDTRECQSWH